jgi:hypothetical protein
LGLGEEAEGIISTPKSWPSPVGDDDVRAAARWAQWESTKRLGIFGSRTANVRNVLAKQIHEGRDHGAKTHDHVPS